MVFRHCCNMPKQLQTEQLESVKVQVLSGSYPGDEEILEDKRTVNLLTQMSIYV